MGKSKIEWLADGSGEAGATWNPLRGCRRISPGCQSCYAETMAARFSGPGLAFHGYAEMTASGPRWSGKIRLIPEKLRDPLSWKNPRRIFVCSMSDLFHEQLPFSVVDQVFAVMVQCPQHTFLVLTKRAERLAQYFSTGDRGATLAAHPNIQVGISAENQEYFDARYPHLKQVPAAVRYISAEPLLGPIRLPPDAAIDWAIVGGESGLRPRYMNPDWCRALLRDCRAQNIAYFLKQMGTVWARSELKKMTKGGKMEELPEDLRVREYPTARSVSR